MAAKKSFAAWLRYKEKSKIYSESNTLGNYVHTLMLEPEKLQEKFFVFEKIDGRKDKAGKAELEKQIANLPRFVTPIEKSEIGKIQRQAEEMVHSIKSHPVYKELVESDPDVKFEESGEIELFDCRLSGKVDIISHKNKVILDIKTTNDASQAGVYMAFVKQNPVEGEIYRAIFGDDYRFIYIAVESHAPYLCAFYEIPESIAAQNLIVDVAEKFSSDFDRWEKSGGTYIPGYDDKIKQIHLKDWDLRL